MSEYRVTLTRSARKELERLEKRTVTRIFTTIESLTHQPRPRGSRKLEGADDLWRVRVGDYRIIYRIIDDELIVEVIGVRHRQDAYRP
jgi:mRNA interferase RelE/StbE